MGEGKCAFEGVPVVLVLCRCARVKVVGTGFVIEHREHDQIGAGGHKLVNKEGERVDLIAIDPQVL